jgi:hypothetical protein
MDSLLGPDVLASEASGGDELELIAVLGCEDDDL